jgi:hypothetical protein
MKKLFLAVLLIFISFLFMGQQNTPMKQKRSAFFPAPGTVEVINITPNQIKNGWGQVGNECAGCPSFFYQVSRTKQVYQAEDGIYYYYYYFHFFSNSYYSDGSIATTYLTNVDFIADGVLLIKSPYILLEAGSQKFGAWIRTRNPNSRVQFNVGQMTVY